MGLYFNQWGFLYLKNHGYSIVFSDKTQKSFAKLEKYYVFDLKKKCLSINSHT